MEELWSCDFKGKVDTAAIGDDYIVLGSGNRVFLMDEGGLVWEKRFSATFYRDPFSDVKVSCVDAEDQRLAVGTNFIDGKIYLFRKDGKLLWSHQFATIASLGWRPEDVTALSVGGSCVIAGTEFISEHVYAYTLDRKRLFYTRVGGTVKEIAVGSSEVAVGTEGGLQLFELTGKQVLHADVKNITGIGFLGNLMVVSAQKELMFFENCEKVGSKNVGREIDKISCFDGRIYAFSKKRLAVLSEEGKLLEEYETNTSPISVKKEKALFKKDGELVLCSLPEP